MTNGLTPRGQRSATLLGTGVLVALGGLLLQAVGAPGAAVGVVIGVGGLIVLVGAAYWVSSIAAGRGG